MTRHPQFWLTGREVVGGLIVIAVIIGVLGAPILAELLFDTVSKGVEKAAPGTFFLGAAVLLAGLVTGVRLLDITGAVLMGAVVVAYIIDNYLAPAVVRASAG